MELIITDDIPREDIYGLYVDSVHADYEITQDHIDDRILPAFDAWIELKEKYSLTDWEPEVECSYAEDVGGYSDLIACNDIGDVFIPDWKFGLGAMISPENSHQGRFYGMAARKNSCVDEFFDGAKHLHVVIIQPNTRGEDTLKVWSTNIAAVDEYEVLHSDAVAKAKGPNPTLCAGSWCKYCPAASICPEKSGAARWALQFKPEDLAQLSNSMGLIKELSDWIKAVESSVIGQLEVGAEVKGWKLVAKRATNKWIDEAKVLTRLRRKMGGKKHMVIEKLLTPAQMLKAAKKLDVEIDIELLTHKISSGSTLAAADDKRPAVVNPRTLAAGLAAIS